MKRILNTAAGRSRRAKISQVLLGGVAGAALMINVGCVSHVVQDNSLRAQFQRSIPQNSNWQISTPDSDSTSNDVQPGEFILNPGPQH